MIETPISEMCPQVPAELKYVEFRLPGTFRELVASNNFTNEEIGRIVRCIALDTDIFLTSKIEPEVFYYRQKLIERSNLRKRVSAHRNRAKSGVSAGSVSASMGVTVTQNANVTVTPAEKPSDSSSPLEKTPSNLKEKTPPIIPLKEKTPISLEKTVPRKKPRGKRDRLEEGLALDLFSLAAGKATAESRESGQKRPQDASDVLAHTNGGQDIEGAPRAVGAPVDDGSRIDSRNELAYVPGPFERFWAEYPRRVGKAKAYSAFTKIIRTQKDIEAFMKTLMASLKWWKSQESWRKDNGKFVPYPATWLNRGNWEDSKDNSEAMTQAEFLSSDDESEADLIRRMEGG